MALLQSVLRHACGAVDQVTLTVVTDNKPAIALYNRFGFTTYGVEPHALKTASGYADEMLMVRYCQAGDAESEARRAS